ncbi:MAG TPA: hypothetical protein VEI97_16855 [bacterium]|nr:hypothetical protein [bacterium]
MMVMLWLLVILNTVVLASVVVTLVAAGIVIVKIGYCWDPEVPGEMRDRIVDMPWWRFLMWMGDRKREKKAKDKGVKV